MDIFSSTTSTKIDCNKVFNNLKLLGFYIIIYFHLKFIIQIDLMFIRKMFYIKQSFVILICNIVKKNYNISIYFF